MNNKEFKEQMLKYEFALKTLETDITILLDNYAFQKDYNPVEHIKSRIKSFESAEKKLINRGYEVNLENLVLHVHDMVGIRIVCSFLCDVEEVIKLIKSSKEFKIVEEKDYIKTPKDSGYISYHLLVKVPIHLNDKIEWVEAEIQIRTIAMDFWASLDHKIRYKFENGVPLEVIKEMNDMSLDIKELDTKMEHLNSIMKKYK